jgi:hypothetical protein
MNNQLFNQSQPELEDRIVHLENTLPLLARLSEQQRFINQIDDITVKVDSLKESDETIQTVLKKLLDSYTLSIQNFSDEHKTFYDFMDKSQSKSAQLQDKLVFHVEDASGKISDLVDQQQALASKFTNLQDGMSSHSRFNELNESIAVLSIQTKAVRSDLELVRKTQQLQKDDTNALQYEVTTISKSCDEQKGIVNDLKDALEQIKLEVIKTNKDLNRTIQESVASLKADYLSKIEAIPIPKEVSLDLVKDEFNKKIEPFSFESKNANLRSSNNESKIVVLEKKVEQLYLLINKYELNK